MFSFGEEGGGLGGYFIKTTLTAITSPFTNIIHKFMNEKKGEKR